ncbi:MAG: hypothetical protein PHE61_01915 [Candidatus Omnitrophica bacterium]|nr:hypothetical protein [Candidatus Omnitrophota bacterium]
MTPAILTKSFIVIFMLVVAASFAYAADEIAGDKGGIVEGVGKVAAGGVKGAVEAPNVVGGGVSFGFDFFGQIFDSIGEKSEKPVKGKEPEAKPKADPMTSQAYPGQRQF